jgi:tetratricopeptide (TPR) repeat protein
MVSTGRLTRILCALIAFCLVFVSSGCQGNKDKKKERFLASGQEYFEQEKYPEAMIQFKNAVQLDPRSALGYYRLGLTYLKLGRGPEAFGAFQKSVDVDPGASGAQIQLGNLWLASGRPGDAKQCAEEALKTDPNAWMAWVLLANASVLLKELPEAGEALDKAIEIAPDELLPRMLVAKLHQIKGDNAAAEKAYLDLAKRFPDSLQVEKEMLNFYGRIGRKDKLLQWAAQSLERTPADPGRLEMAAGIYIELAMGPEAVSALERAVSKDPQNGLLHMQLGRVYLRTGKRNRAKAEFEKAVALTGDNPAAKIVLADLLLNEGSLEEAEILTGQLLEQRPDDPAVLSLQGKLHLLKGEYDSAIETFQAAISRAPSVAASHYFLGKARTAKGQIRLAERDFLKAGELDPKQAATKIALAELYVIRQEGKLAEPLLTEIIQERGEDPKLLWLLAQALRFQGRFEEAEQVVERFIAGSPEKAEGYYEFGRILQAWGKPDEALPQFRKAAALNPKAANAAAAVAGIFMARNERRKAEEWLGQCLPRVDDKALLFNLLGRIALSDNDLEQAKKDFRSSIDANPDMLDSYLSLAGVYRRQNAEEDAVRLYESLLERNPESPSVLMLIGMLYETMGRESKAARYYEKALEINPDFGSAANNLAWYYAEEGDDLGRALLLAEKARERLPENPFVADTLGWICEKKGLHYKARILLEESRAGLPDNPTIHYHLGVTYFSLGEKDNARASLEKSLRLNPGFPEAKQAEELLRELIPENG